jgi:hypothetical protein
MPDWSWNMDFVAIAEAAGVIALAVAAATPTKDDDGVVGRVVNLARIVVPFLRPKA